MEGFEIVFGMGVGQRKGYVRIALAVNMGYAKAVTDNLAAILFGLGNRRAPVEASGLDNMQREICDHHCGHKNQ